MTTKPFEDTIFIVNGSPRNSFPGLEIGKGVSKEYYKVTDGICAREGTTSNFLMVSIAVSVFFKPTNSIFKRLHGRSWFVTQLGNCLITGKVHLFF